MTDSRDLFTLLSVNAWDLYASSDAAKQARYRGLEALLAAQQADLIIIHEIIAEGADRDAKAAGAASGLRRLAEATGLECEVDGEPLVAAGGVIHNSRLPWRRIPPSTGNARPSRGWLGRAIVTDCVLTGRPRWCRRSSDQPHARRP